MSSKIKGEIQGEEVPLNRIRIMLTSRNPQSLEKVSSNLISQAQKEKVKFKGVRRLPVKTLRITTRKSPCGEGTNTWDRFELRIHKRVIDFYSTPSVVHSLTRINIEHGVYVEIVIQ